MKSSRIAATLGAVALGGLLVASKAAAPASAHPQRPAHAHPAVHHHFEAPVPHKLRPHSNLPMGLHCDSTDMSF